MKDWYSHFFELEYTFIDDATSESLNGSAGHIFITDIDTLNILDSADKSIGSVHLFRQTNNSGKDEFLTGEVTSIKEGIVEFKLKKVGYEN